MMKFNETVNRQLLFTNHSAQNKDHSEELSSSRMDGRQWGCGWADHCQLTALLNTQDIFKQVMY